MPDDQDFDLSSATADPVDREGKVARVLDGYTIVINKGRMHGLHEGQRVLIYALAEEVLDPDTGESLGELEIVKGTGKINHLQDRLATVISDMTAPAGRTIRSPRSFLGAVSLLNLREEEILPASRVAFEDLMIGDHVRLI